SPRSWYSWTRVAFDYSAITSYPLFSLFLLFFLFFFFFNDTAPTEIYTLSLHDALPISARRCACPVSCFRQGRAACAAAAAGHRWVAVALSGRPETAAARRVEQPRLSHPGRLVDGPGRKREARLRPQVPESRQASAEVGRAAERV